MTRPIALAALLVAFALPAAAQAPPEFMLGTPVSSHWDYTLAAITGTQVTKFEGQFDTQPVVNTGLPPNAVAYVYPWPQALLTPGPHTAQIRACSLRGCGPWDAKSFVVAVPLPPGILNHRVVPGNTPLALNKAADRANAFAELVGLDRHLQPQELRYVAERYQQEHPGEPLIHGLLIQTLLGTYAALVGR